MAKTRRGARTDSSNAGPGGLSVTVGRADGWSNVLTGLGTSRDKRVYNRIAPALISRQEAEALYQSDDMAARIIEEPVKEMLRKWIDVSIHASSRTGQLKTDKKASEALADELEVLKLKACLYDALRWERAYGGSAIVPLVDDGVTDQAKPLNETSIRKVHGFLVLESQELYPASYYEDPKDLVHFGSVETYAITQWGGANVRYAQRIHESRVIKFPGIQTSKLHALARNGWGDSVFVRVLEVLSDYGGAWGSAGHLVTDISQTVLKMRGLAEALATGKEDLVRKRLEAMEMSRSVIRAAVLDAGDEMGSGQESLERKGTPLSGLPELLDRFNLRLAAAADMPVTRLMGANAGGFAKADESGERWWAERISSLQEDRLRSPLERVVRLVLLSKEGPTGGKEPEKWNLAFRPTRELDPIQEATRRNTNAQADAALVNAGVLMPEEVAVSRYGGDRYGEEIILDSDLRAKMEEEQEAQKEVQAAQQEAQKVEAELRAKAAANGEPPPGKGGPPGAPGGGKPPFRVVRGGKEDAADSPCRGCDYFLADFTEFNACAEHPNGIPDDVFGSSSPPPCFQAIREDEGAWESVPRGEDGKWTGGGGRSPESPERWAGAQPSAVPPPPPPTLSKEEREARLARSVERSARSRARVAELAKTPTDRAFGDRHGNAEKYLVHKNTRPGEGPWRVTFLNAEGMPFGHVAAATYERVLQVAHEYGADLATEIRIDAWDDLLAFVADAEAWEGVPRDEGGRWSGGGAKSGAISKPSKRAQKIMTPPGLGAAIAAAPPAMPALPAEKAVMPTVLANKPAQIEAAKGPGAQPPGPATPTPHEPAMPHPASPSAPPHVKAAAALAAKLVPQAAALEPHITKSMRGIESDTAKLVGLQFAVKGERSLARKIATDVEDFGWTPEHAASKIGDRVRYTLEVQPERYTEEVTAALAKLEAEGYRVVPGKFKNYWPEPGSPRGAYNGINVNLDTPQGVRIELQFHTPASFHTKEDVNHKLYEEARLNSTSRERRAELTEAMERNWESVPIPAGAGSIRWPR